MRPESTRATLVKVRGLIDGVDDALVVLLAGRRRLVAFAASIKHDAGQPVRDPGREREVRLRARRLGRRLGVPEANSDRLMSVLIADACEQQGSGGWADPPSDPQISARVDLHQGRGEGDQRMLPPAMILHATRSIPTHRWLRLLPPPTRLAPLLRHLPQHWQARWLEQAMQRVLSAPVADGALDALRLRRIGIEVSDLGLRWVVCLQDGHLRVCAPGEPAEATVRGTATDLLLLASRREDADTLFFQRRLLLTGDVELGLTARNLLDQLPWQDVPLGLRIALHRGAGLAQLARAAYRGQAIPG